MYMYIWPQLEAAVKLPDIRWQQDESVPRWRQQPSPAFPDPASCIGKEII